MRALLDTHILLWAIAGDRKLPETARQMIEDDTNLLYASVVSLWEVAIKHAAKPQEMPLSAGRLLEICRAADLTVLPIRDSHIVGLETLSRREDAPAHKDPFDRMLVAQARKEDLMLLTHDGRLADYGGDCVLVV